MKRIVVVLLLGLAGCGDSALSGVDAARPVTVNQRVSYYDISGNTETELRQQMNEKGILGTDGRRYDAATTWNLSWDFADSCGAEDCTINAFTTRVDILFIYPRWTPPADASADLVLKWNTYIRNLTTHENGHRDLAVNAASELSNSALVLPSAPDLASLQQELSAFTGQRISALNADEAAYDTATCHGATQGAVFP